MAERKATHKDVRKWLELLVGRLPVTMSVKEQSDRIRLMVPSLALAHPGAAYCESSLDAIVGTHRWPSFPAEADIRQAVADWWRENNPNAAHIMPPDVQAAPFDATGKGWIMTWRARQKIGDEAAARCLALIRFKAPEVYAYLSRTDLDAAAMLVRRGWADPGIFTAGHLEAHWSDPETVAAALRTCAGHYLDGSRDFPSVQQQAEALCLLRAILSRYAPHNLRLLPATLVPALQSEVLPPDAASGLLGA